MTGGLLDALIARTIAGEVQARTDQGETALHLLARDARPIAELSEVMRRLVAAGADPSALNHTGQTPIEVAAREELRALIQALGGKTARQAIKPTPTHRHR
jgi:ankyrin repeat protein